MKYLSIFLAGILLSQPVFAGVTLPYTFSSGGSISASQVNANFGALRDEVNTHEAQANGHNTTIASVLSVGNTLASTPINFNLTQALSMLVENLSADPVCGAPSAGRMIWNTTSSLLKVCNGSSYVSIAGTGVNTLSSVLNAGNSAGSYNLNLNGNQLLNARVENLSSDPSPSATGRMFFNTSSNTLKLDTGSSILAVGGAQGLSSVLGVSNSAGSTNINFNGNQGLNFRLEQLSSDPGSSSKGRAYYNTTTDKPRFYNGSAWSDIGNTNTLAQTLALGNSTGSADIDFNGHQSKNMRLHNLAAPPGTGTAGQIWYDTVSNTLGYETTSSNRTVCSLDDTQVLTNKTISGSSNTLSNIPDSALSANVGLLNGTQTITGTKTFSSAPVISRVKTASGTTLGHLLTDGLSDDTFTLNNAVQELRGKTLNAPTLSGNLDFNYYQAMKMRAENVSSTPAAGNAGRIIFKSSTGELLYDNGSSWFVLGVNTTPNLGMVLSAGNSAGTSNLDLNHNQLLNTRIENVAVNPSPGHTGRPVFNTTDGKLYIDTGSTLRDVAAASLASGHILVGNASNAATDVAMSGDASISNTGAVSISSVGTSSATNIHNAELLANAATSSATPSTIVKRGASSEASFGNVTATSGTINGNADAIQLAVRRQNSSQTSNIQEWQTELNATLASVSKTGVITATSFSGNASSATTLAADPAACSANQWATDIAANGTLTCAQPAFSNISGSVAASQLPNPSSSTLGGVQSKAAVAGSYMSAISTSGVPALTAFTAPTIQKFTTGSGTYTTPANVLYIHVRMVGGGGQGSGSGGAGGSSGGSGGSSTFSVMSAGGGGGGTFQGAGGTGGTATLGSGPVGFALAGGGGTAASITNATGVAWGFGPTGAASPFGGAGGGTVAATTGGAGVTNSGSGGGAAGSGNAAGAWSGSSGGAGGYVDAIIFPTASQTFSYVVGAGGSGAGAAGATGQPGGAGGSGLIIVEEHYQ